MLLRRKFDKLLSAQIKYADNAENLEKTGILLCAIPEREVHIYAGIERLAEELGCEIEKECVLSENGSYIRAEFEYMGFTIFQLSEEDESFI